MFSTIKNYGVSPLNGLQKNKNIRLLNTLSPIAGIFTGLYSIIFFISISNFIGWLLLPFTFFTLFVPILSKWGFFEFAKRAVLLLVNFTFFSIAACLGPESGMFSTFYVLVGIPFLYFCTVQKRDLIIFCTIPFLLAIFLQLALPTPFPQINLPDTTLYIFRSSVIVSTLIFVILLVYKFYMENELHVKEIKNALTTANHHIKEKEEKEAHLIAAKEVAEKASKAKKEFLSTMSHEIRTPLNAIIGLTGILTETKLNPEQKEFLNIVRLSGESLLSIINDILDFSKIESGKLELEESNFELVDPIEDTFELLSNKAHEKGIELLNFTKENVPKMVQGDIARLRQILINLVNNALKFTEQGEIMVRVEQLKKEGQKHFLQFEVKDTGIGIPKEKMKRLFKSFSQVDASTTRKYGGTGLGLVISKRLIELMGGKIWVESEVGFGTSFFFTITLNEVDKSLTKINYNSSDLKGKKVLLVDDNFTNLKILQLQCAKWGLEVHSTNLPERGLELALQLNYDLAILDMSMPGMDGLELAKRIREKKSPNELAIILLSSIAYKLNEEDKNLFGAVLSKPARKKQLRNTVFHLLTKEIFTKTTSTSQKDVIANDFKIIQNLKILIAEDNLANQKVFRQILKRIGLKVDIVGNGKEAVEVTKMISYDLIFMDVQMPIMDGLEATRNINKHFKNNQSNRPIIIALTANAFKEDRELCLNAGMDDFLSKPVKKSEILQVLTKYFKTSNLKKVETKI